MGITHTRLVLMKMGKGQKSYHPVIAFVAETKEILHSWFRYQGEVEESDRVARRPEMGGSGRECRVGASGPHFHEDKFRL